MSDLEIKTEHGTTEQARDLWEELMYALDSLQNVLERVKVTGLGVRESLRTLRSTDGGSTAQDAEQKPDTGPARDRSESGQAPVAGSDCHGSAEEQRRIDEETVIVQVRPGVFREVKRTGLRNRVHAESIRRVKLGRGQPDDDVPFD